MRGSGGGWPHRCGRDAEQSETGPSPARISADPTAKTPGGAMSTSDSRNIDSPHETRPFKAHGHLDVVNWATSPWAVGSSSLAGAGPTTSSPSPAPTVARPTTRGSVSRGRWPSSQRWDRDADRDPATSSSSNPDTTRGPWRRSLRPPRHRHRRLRQARLIGNDGSPLCNARLCPGPFLDRGTRETRFGKERLGVLLEVQGSRAC